MNSVVENIALGASEVFHILSVTEDGKNCLKLQIIKNKNRTIRFFHNGNILSFRASKAVFDIDSNIFKLTVKIETSSTYRKKEKKEVSKFFDCEFYLPEIKKKLKHELQDFLETIGENNSEDIDDFASYPEIMYESTKLLYVVFLSIMLDEVNLEHEIRSLFNVKDDIINVSESFDDNAFFLFKILNEIISVQPANIERIKI
jgi:hypothetical protein